MCFVPSCACCVRKVLWIKSHVSLVTGEWLLDAQSRSSHLHWEKKVKIFDIVKDEGFKFLLKFLTTNKRI